MSVGQFEGALVEIDCSVLGVYRGVIESVNESDQSVAISKASKDGKKLVYPDVVIAAADIANIRFLDKSTSPVLKERNSSNGTNGTRSPLKANRGSNDKDSNGKDHQQQRTRTTSNSLSTSRARRDKECFGVASDEATLYEDFDFEKNLELFNKAKVFAEINRATKGENVVRLADCNIRKDKKYRHDENVLSNLDKVVSREEKRSIWFTVVPSAIKIPAVTRPTRDLILHEATKLGISVDSLREAMARDICSVILQQNNRSSVVFVVSPEKVSGSLNVSLCGITAARQLAGKVKNLYVLCNRAVTDGDGAFLSELELCRLAGVRVVDSMSAATRADIVVGCTLHPYLDQCGQLPSTTVLLVDPPFYSANLADMVLFPLLPLQSSVPLENDVKCRLYIGDLGVPAKLFDRVDVNAEGLYPQDGFVARIKRA